MKGSEYLPRGAASTPHSDGVPALLHSLHHASRHELGMNLLEASVPIEHGVVHLGAGQ